MVLGVAMVFIFWVLVAMLVFQKWLKFTIDRLQQIYVKCSHKTSANVHESREHWSGTSRAMVHPLCEVDLYKRLRPSIC